jgi:hypothetical protein
LDENSQNVSDASSGLNAEDAPPPMPNPAAFAPANPTDNRETLDWASKCPAEARRDMWLEGIYLAILLTAVPLLLLALWLEVPKRWFGLTDEKYAPYSNMASLGSVVSWAALCSRSNGCITPSRDKSGTVIGVCGVCSRHIFPVGWHLPL